LISYLLKSFPRYCRIQLFKWVAQFAPFRKFVFCFYLST
jgi:hypothetical protein